LMLFPQHSGPTKQLTISNFLLKSNLDVAIWK
jgi:hypothetical protein